MDLRLDDTGERPVIRLERRFPHSVRKVWVALTDPAELDGWFPWHARIDPRIGGTIEFRDKGSDLRMDAVITEFDPPRVFAYTWGGERLRWELHDEGDACRLVFTHEINERSGSAKFAAGWHLCVDTLAARLDGTDYTPPPDRISYLNMEYVRAFGLLAGEIIDTADGSVLRFDLELFQSPAEVWAALAAGAGIVPDGPPTEEIPYTVFAYEIPGGVVRWTLSEQPFGTRLTLTQTGPLTTLTAAQPVWSARLAELTRRPRGVVNR